MTNYKRMVLLSTVLEGLVYLWCEQLLLFCQTHFGMGRVFATANGDGGVQDLCESDSHWRYLPRIPQMHRH